LPLLASHPDDGDEDTQAEIDHARGETDDEDSNRGALYLDGPGDKCQTDGDIHEPREHQEKAPEITQQDMFDEFRKALPRIVEGSLHHFSQLGLYLRNGALGGLTAPGDKLPRPLEVPGADID
jgi:hypothetical protein